MEMLSPVWVLAQEATPLGPFLARYLCTSVKGLTEEATLDSAPCVPLEVNFGFSRTSPTN